eukprot:scaffold7607_cov171-Skeletonema_marinoi.AAC.3
MKLLWCFPSRNGLIESAACTLSAVLLFSRAHSSRVQRKEVRSPPAAAEIKHADEITNAME